MKVPELTDFTAMNVRSSILLLYLHIKVNLNFLAFSFYCLIINCNKILDNKKRMYPINIKFTALSKTLSLAELN